MSKIYSRPRIRIPKVILSSSRRGKNRNKQKATKIILILTIAIATAKLILDAILPIFNTLCEDKAKSIATIVSNEQATVVMSEHTYDELFTIEKNNNGNVTMIKSNVYAINEIISDVAVKIQEEIERQGKDNVEIALGSFTGFSLLSGKGPGIKLQIASIGNVQTDLRSEFSSQGINQTLHRVYLQVICEVSILTPFENIQTDITNQVLLAENVIVGNIPNTYYNLEGMDTDKAVEIIE
jgi:sporulation protein YunB